MENAVEALKIAGAMLMFVLALTLSISSFSTANASINAITTMPVKLTLRELHPVARYNWFFTSIKTNQRIY